MFETISKLQSVKGAWQGKVRDIYDFGDKLLLVTSDRISAFDVVFQDMIPDKGIVLNKISVYNFNATKHIISNHFITDNVDEYPEELKPHKQYLKDRSMLVYKSKVIPFECIVRGYITGSAWIEYKKTGTIGNMMMPEEILESQKFQHPLFTPSTKAENGHDINISYRELLHRMDERLAAYIKNKAIELYSFAHDKLLKNDIIVADTKFEFGTIDADVYLIDEVLTPDSSRFWDRESYEIGKTPLSFDKQYIRDYVSASGWDKNPPAPALPEEVIMKTREKYIQCYKIITGDSDRKW